MNRTRTDLPHRGSGGGPVAGSGRTDGPPAVRWSPARRRRDVPHLVTGVALVVAGALGSVVLTSHQGRVTQALILTRDVAAGQVLSAADLRAEPVLAGTRVRFVSRSDAATVLGRAAALPLSAGHLIGPDDVGGAHWPPSGQVLMATAASPGTYPPELAAGMHVLLTAIAPDDAAGALGATAPGTVASADVAVTPARSAADLRGAPQAVVVAVRGNPSGSGGAVVSLLLSRDAAAAAAAVWGSRLRLMVVPATDASPTGVSPTGVSPSVSGSSPAPAAPAPTETTAPPGTPASVQGPAPAGPVPPADGGA